MEMNFTLSMRDIYVLCVETLHALHTRHGFAAYGNTFHNLHTLHGFAACGDTLHSESTRGMDVLRMDTHSALSVRGMDVAVDAVYGLWAASMYQTGTVQTQTSLRMYGTDRYRQVPYRHRPVYV
jgi:hypothetical protein